VTPGGDATESDEQQVAELDPLVQAQEESKRFKDQLLRTAADFDNFRKRSKREVSEATERGREDLLKELLPVFDNLERASEHAKTASDVAALSDGIQLVMKQFVDTLARLHIEKIDAVGQPFDPSVHEAIQQLETADVPAGTVANQVQAGYKLGERLVRPCMVVVAKAPSE
jgi:molecular chaperone GrpE